MKVLLIFGLLVIAGCSTSAFDDRQEVRILNLIGDAAFKENPDLFLNKCYELSAPTKQACFDEYLWAKQAKGEEVLASVCERIGCS